jgi:hypothetical protein
MKYATTNRDGTHKDIDQAMIHGPNVQHANSVLYALTHLNPIGFLNTGFTDPENDDVRGGYVKATIAISKYQMINDVFNVSLAVGAPLYFVISFQPGHSATQTTFNYGPHYFCKNRPDLWDKEFDPLRGHLTAAAAMREGYVYARPVITPFAGYHPRQWKHFDTIFRAYDEFPVAILFLGTVIVPNSKHNVPTRGNLPYHSLYTRKYSGIPIPTNLGMYSGLELKPTKEALPGGGNRLEPLFIDIAPPRWEVIEGRT